MSTLAQIKGDFERLWKSGSLGQAYVFWGQDVFSTFEFVKSLASFLEEGRWDGPRSIFLDSKFIDGSKQQLGIDTAREFAEFIYKKPVAGGRRLLCIGSAAELTVESQNAILKLVEEPPENSLIILVLRDVNLLLAPLRSRLASVYVSPVISGEAKKNEIEERADELVKKFLSSKPEVRSKIIKDLVEEDSETRDEIRGKIGALHEGFIVEPFLRALIAELYKKPEQNWRILKELLKRQSAIEDFSTSKKLQIEAALQFLA